MNVAKVWLNEFISVVATRALVNGIANSTKAVDVCLLQRRQLVQLNSSADVLEFRRLEVIEEVLVLAFECASTFHQRCTANTSYHWQAISVDEDGHC